MLSEGRYTIFIILSGMLDIIVYYVRSMLPSDLQLMLKPDCKASVDVITEKYSGVCSASKYSYQRSTSMRILP